MAHAGRFVAQRLRGADLEIAIRNKCGDFSSLSANDDLACVAPHNNLSVGAKRWLRPAIPYRPARRSSEFEITVQSLDCPREQHPWIAFTARGQFYDDLGQFVSLGIVGVKFKARTSSIERLSHLAKRLVVESFYIAERHAQPGCDAHITVNFCGRSSSSFVSTITPQPLTRSISLPCDGFLLAFRQLIRFVWS